MKYKLLLINLLLISTFAYSQTIQKETTFNKFKVDLELQAGVIIGGMSPISMPVEIREILKYSPDFNGMFEVQATKWISDDLGISTGIRFENKGMETDARVKSYKTQIINDGNETKGYWSGSVNTVAKISYLTVPLLINSQIYKRWRLQLGGFFSYNMTGKFMGKVYDGYLRENTPVGIKVEFKDGQYAAYDFSDKLRKVSYGTQLSGQWQATNNLHVLMQFTWGLNNIFKRDFNTISFNMLPIYISVGASYKI